MGIARKRAAAPKVVQAKGIAPKPVTLSYEAKEAIREIQKQVRRIGGKRTGSGNLDRTISGISA
jgi:hypothetical protein